VDDIASSTVIIDARHSIVAPIHRARSSKTIHNIAAIFALRSRFVTYHTTNTILALLITQTVNIGIGVGRIEAVDIDLASSMIETFAGCTVLKFRTASIALTRRGENGGDRIQEKRNQHERQPLHH
jgi:hypothetical protein